MHVMARGQHLVPSSIPFHLILRQGHSLNLEPTDWLEWLPSKLLGFPCLHLPRIEIIGVNHHTWLFMWVL